MCGIINYVKSDIKSIIENINLKIKVQDAWIVFCLREREVGSVFETKELVCQYLRLYSHMFSFWFFLYIWEDYVVYLLARSRFNSVTKRNGMATHPTSFSIHMISNNSAIHNLEIVHFAQYQ